MNIQGMLPSITAPLMGASAIASKVIGKASGATAQAAATGKAATAGNGTSATSLQDTFLNLLVTELQNQDPTAPVDPTQMVGQLVSLNQLDQLISINSTLSNLATTPTATGSAQAGASQAASPATAAASAMANSALSGAGTGASGNTATSLAAAEAALQKLQYAKAAGVNPSTLMNLYSNMGTSAQAH